MHVAEIGQFTVQICQCNLGGIPSKREVGLACSCWVGLRSHHLQFTVTNPLKLMLEKFIGCPKAEASNLGNVKTCGTSTRRIPQSARNCGIHGSWSPQPTDGHPCSRVWDGVVHGGILYTNTLGSPNYCCQSRTWFLCPSFSWKSPGQFPYIQNFILFILYPSVGQ